MIAQTKTLGAPWRLEVSCYRKFTEGASEKMSLGASAALVGTSAVWSMGVSSNGGTHMDGFQGRSEDEMDDP